MKRVALGSFLALLCWGFAPHAASASGGDISMGRAQVGATLGFGLDLDDDYRLNPYLFGTGIKGGYTFDPVNIYVGGVFLFWLGEDDRLGYDANYIIITPEFGYDFEVGPLVIRPTVMLGLAILSVDWNDPRGNPWFRGYRDDSDMALMLGPGGALLYGLNDHWWIGGNVHIFIIPDDVHVSGISFMGQGGYSF